MSKVRNHNEWFRTVLLGGRKSCPHCKEKLDEGESIWSWGEYLRAKWRTITHFCKKCFPAEVKERLESHVKDCGCEVSICTKGRSVLPSWFTLNVQKNCPPTK